MVTGHPGRHYTLCRGDSCLCHLGHSSQDQWDIQLVEEYTDKKKGYTVNSYSFILAVSIIEGPSHGHAHTHTHLAALHEYAHTNSNKSQSTSLPTETRKRAFVSIRVNTHYCHEIHWWKYPGLCCWVSETNAKLTRIIISQFKIIHQLLDACIRALATWLKSFLVYFGFHINESRMEVILACSNTLISYACWNV